MRVIHIPCYSLADPLPALREHLKLLEPYGSVGLVATAQHLNRLDDVKAFLEAAGKRVMVGGQVLGCRQDNAVGLDADCILYVGSGRFHPLGIAYRTEKPVFMLNPLSGVLDRITDEEKRRWLGRRRGALMRALDSKTFGIMVSTKDGQYDMEKAMELKAKLEARGKEAFIFAAEELSPGNLLAFRVDVWVNTACPRMAADEYDRPIVNAKELEAMLDDI